MQGIKESLEDINYSMFMIRSYAETMNNNFIKYHIDIMEGKMSNIEVELNSLKEEEQ